MRTLPDKCKNINSVGSFCDCLADAESVDVDIAAKGFCRQSAAGGVAGTTGDDLAELKNALKDMES